MDVRVVVQMNGRVLVLFVCLFVCFMNEGTWWRLGDLQKQAGLPDAPEGLARGPWSWFKRHSHCHPPVIFFTIPLNQENKMQGP